MMQVGVDRLGWRARGAAGVEPTLKGLVELSICRSRSRARRASAIFLYRMPKRHARTLDRPSKRGAASIKVVNVALYLNAWPGLSLLALECGVITPALVALTCLAARRGSEATPTL